MKTLLLTLILLLGSASIASPHKGEVRYGQYELSHGKHLQKQRFVKVVQSRPVYREVVTYGECRSHPNLRHSNSGALIGAVVGGLIGSRVAVKDQLPHVVGGAVTGAIVGSAISVHPQRPQRYCQYTEQRLVGYRNIAYWHGKKITQFSERPLRKIALRHPNVAHYARQRGE